MSLFYFTNRAFVSTHGVVYMIRDTAGKIKGQAENPFLGNLAISRRNIIHLENIGWFRREGGASVKQGPKFLDIFCGFDTDI